MRNTRSTQNGTGRLYAADGAKTLGSVFGAPEERKNAAEKLADENHIQSPLAKLTFL